jgi:ribosomal protein L29
VVSKYSDAERERIISESRATLARLRHKGEAPAPPVERSPPLIFKTHNEAESAAAVESEHDGDYSAEQLAELNSFMTGADLLDTVCHFMRNIRDLKAEVAELRQQIASNVVALPERRRHG